MEWYSKFNGKNMGGILIPKVLNNTKKKSKSNTTTSKSKSTKPSLSLADLDIPLDLNLFRQSALHTNDDGFATIAWTTLDDVRREFFGLVKRWTYDKAKKESLKYYTVNDYNKNSANSGVYFAKENGYYDEFISHMEKAWSPKWNLETTTKEALKYKSLNEFRTKSQGAYAWAKRNNFFDDVTKHMESNVKWNKETILAETKKFKTLKDFTKINSRAYQVGLSLGINFNIVTSNILSNIVILATYFGLGSSKTERDNTLSIFTVTFSFIFLIRSLFIIKYLAPQNCADPVLS
jgi:hypothetical protein